MELKDQWAKLIELAFANGFLKTLRFDSFQVGANYSVRMYQHGLKRHELSFYDVCFNQMFCKAIFGTTVLTIKGNEMLIYGLISELKMDKAEGIIESWYYHLQRISVARSEEDLVEYLYNQAKMEGVLK